MTPNPSIRLGSVMQTLEQVVFPAVDPSNSLAVEQCGVIAAQLKMFLRHLPVIGIYHSLCRDDLVATVSNLPLAAGGDLTQEAATKLQSCLEGAACDTDAAAAFHRVGFALEDLLRAAARDGAPDYRWAMNEKILQFAKRQKDRERIWFKDAGFDPRPEELPDLETLLAGH